MYSAIHELLSSSLHAQLVVLRFLWSLWRSCLVLEVGIIKKKTHTPDSKTPKSLFGWCLGELSRKSKTIATRKRRHDKFKKKRSKFMTSLVDRLIRIAIATKRMCVCYLPARDAVMRSSIGSFLKRLGFFMTGPASFLPPLPPTVGQFFRQSNQRAATAIKQRA